MKKKFLLSVLAATTAAHATTPQILNDANVKWQQVPNHSTVQYAVLSGDPLKKDWFTIRLKMPADYKDVIHSHDSIRYDTIISGAYYSKFGDTLDYSNAKKLAAGDFFECPANSNHFGYTKEETIIQISGLGPWEVLAKQS